jgi:hypothetical protein
MKRVVIILLLIILNLEAKEAYCTDDTLNIRETDIFIDLSSIDSKRFAKEIIKSLKDNLLPHEKLKIFSFNSNKSMVDLVFDGCVPGLTKKEISTIKKGGVFKYLFGGNPIDRVKEDRVFFQSSIKEALKKIYKKREANSNYKPIIETLYTQSMQFKNRKLKRVVIYSDMMQNSQEFMIKDLIDKRVDFKKIDEYKMDFNLAQIYILTPSLKRISNYRSLQKFWRKFFERNRANVLNFSTSMDISRFDKITYKIYKGEVSINGKRYRSTLYLNYSDKNILTNSWLVVNDIDAVPLVGRVKIVDNCLKSAQLKIDKIFNKYHPMFRSGEKLKLKFDNQSVKGTLTIDNSKVTIDGKVVKEQSFKLNMKEDI